MATSGLGVWIALDKNPLIKLFHATSTAFLGQIDIKQPVNSMLSCKSLATKPSPKD